MSRSIVPILFDAITLSDHGLEKQRRYKLLILITIGYSKKLSFSKSDLTLKFCLFFWLKSGPNFFPYTKNLHLRPMHHWCECALALRLFGKECMVISITIGYIFRGWLYLQGRRNRRGRVARLPPSFDKSFNPIKTTGQIMPTTLLRVPRPPAFQTFWQPCLVPDPRST